MAMAMAMAITTLCRTVLQRPVRLHKKAGQCPFGIPHFQSEKQLYFRRRWLLPRSMYRQAAEFATETRYADHAICYSDAGVKRATEYRTKSSWLLNAFSSSDSLVVPLAKNRNLIKDGQPLIVPSYKIEAIKKQLQFCEPIFLGLTENQDTPVFAIDVTDLFSAEGSKPTWLEGAELMDLRKYGPNLKASEAGLLAYAQGMVEWHSQNRFCGRCGTRIIPKDGGHSLKCPTESCNAVAYPRLDPAVIMLVTLGDYVLLGRQSKWETGRYSLLAGFVEIGETLEMAVAREVQEEVGINVDIGSIRYIASQPWPFPSSVMLGFISNAKKDETKPFNGSPSRHGQIIPIANSSLSTVYEINSLPKLTVNADELEDARWIHKDFLRAVLVGKALPFGVKFHVPGKHAIARHLMEIWVAKTRCGEWSGDDIETVEIDEGVFKYVLIRVHDSKGNQKLIVRGNSALPYHVDILEQTRDKIGTLRFQADPLGGGRMEHHPEHNIIHVYGFSQAYGQANHEVTAVLLRQWFPFHEISVSWDGY